MNEEESECDVLLNDLVALVEDRVVRKEKKNLDDKERADADAAAGAIIRKAATECLKRAVEGGDGVAKEFPVKPGKFASAADAISSARSAIASAGK